VAPGSSTPHEVWGFVLDRLKKRYGIVPAHVCPEQKDVDTRLLNRKEHSFADPSTRIYPSHHLNQYSSLCFGACPEPLASPPLLTHSKGGPAG
jgi:hypothetical protein